MSHKKKLTLVADSMKSKKAAFNSLTGLEAVLLLRYIDGNNELGKMNDTRYKENELQLLEVARVSKERASDTLIKNTEYAVILGFTTYDNEESKYLVIVKTKCNGFKFAAQFPSYEAAGNHLLTCNFNLENAPKANLFLNL